MFNIDKRILAQLREECLEIERNGALNPVDHESELPVDVRALFDSVVALATDDEIAQIDAFFEQEQTEVTISTSKDKDIKAAIQRICVNSMNVKRNVSLADQLGFSQAAVAFRSSEKGADDRTLKAVQNFARELCEEEDAE